MTFTNALREQDEAAFGRWRTPAKTCSRCCIGCRSLLLKRQPPPTRGASPLNH